MEKKTIFSVVLVWFSFCFGWAVVASPAPFAYITNTGSDNVSVIEIPTNIVIATVPVGAAPRGVAINASGTLVYVANNNSGTVSVIDTSTNTVVGTVPVGDLPYGVVVNPAGTLVYVTGGGTIPNGILSVIDAATNIVVASVPVESAPTGVAINPTSTRVYVANNNSNSISVVDTATNTVIATIPVGIGPLGIAVNPSGTLIYVTHYYDFSVGPGNTLSVINISTNALTGIIEVGLGPAAVAVDPTRNFIYVANSVSSNVSVINAATNIVIATVVVGDAPRGVSVTPDGSRVYVAINGNNTVSVIDTASNTVIDTVSVGANPHAFGQFIGPAPSGVQTSELSVNGHKVVGQQEKWVRFVASEVVRQLFGSRDNEIRVASRSTWWGLKEGTFSLANPHVHSTCSVLQKNGRSKDVRLGPLEVCSPGRAWQVGLAAVQVPNFTEQEVFDTVSSLWPGRLVTDVLAEAAILAKFDPAQGMGAAIVTSSGDLRKSWLLRHPVVGLTLVEINVTNECVNDDRSWCYGTGWKETKDYAPSRDAALRSISDLAGIFDALAPQ